MTELNPQGKNLSEGNKTVKQDKNNDPLWSWVSIFPSL